MSEVLWERMKAHELRDLAAKNAVVIVPVASIEQHGPHLPTMTDTRIGREIAVRAARRASPKRRVVVAPVVWCGLSEHHMSFGGTITLTPETFQRVLREVVGALVRLGFHDILLSNSHGGNHIAMQHAAETLSMELRATIIATTYLREAAEAITPLLDDQAGVHHACEAETSMMLALEPDLVDASALDRLATPADPPLLLAGKASFRWRPFSGATRNGVIGNPARATAAKGESLLDAIAGALADLVTDGANWANPHAPSNEFRGADRSNRG